MSDVVFVAQWHNEHWGEISKIFRAKQWATHWLEEKIETERVVDWKIWEFESIEKAEDFILYGE